MASLAAQRKKKAGHVARRTAKHYVPPSAATASSCSCSHVDNNISMPHDLVNWMDTTLVADPERSVDSRSITICARTFLMGSGYSAYIDEKQLLLRIQAQFPGSKVELRSEFGQCWRVVNGITWTEQHLQKTMDGAKSVVPRGPILQTIISAAPEKHELLRPHHLIEKHSYAPDDSGRPGIHSLVCDWVEEIFAFERGYAVDQEAALNAYNEAFLGMDLPSFKHADALKVKVDPKQFKDILLAIFPKVKSIVLGDGVGKREVYTGLRWIGIVPNMEQDKDNCLSKIQKLLTDNKAGEDQASLREPAPEVTAWLRKVLIADKAAFIDPHDIFIAYSVMLEPHFKTSMRIGPVCMTDAVKFAFPQCTDTSPENAPSTCIVGVRWAALHGCTASVAMSLRPFPEQLRREAHKLLHLPLRHRVIGWLKMHFSHSSVSSVALVSLFDSYEQAFMRSQDTHPLVDEDEFHRILFRVYQELQIVEVSTGHPVAFGIAPRFPVRPADSVCAMFQRQALKAFKSSRAITIPERQTVFARELEREPLFMVPRSESIMASRAKEEGYRIPGEIKDTEQVKILTRGPFVERLTRRARGREPLGDEEPGFPGVSIKRAQRLMKDLVKEYADPRIDEQQESGQQDHLAKWDETTKDLMDKTRFGRENDKPPGPPVQSS